MKSIKLILFLVLVFSQSTSLYSQVIESINEPELNLNYSESQRSYLKAGGDTIWSTTFDWADPDVPRGWSLPDGWQIDEVTDFGFNWIWQKDTFKFLDGTRTMNPPDFFKTADDGFLLFPIQAYNMADGVFTGFDADAYIITEPIDCSAAPSVVVSLSQYFRYCCGNVFLEMAVSNDEGIHWAVYDMTFGTPDNSVVPPRYKMVEINISDVAAGMSNVLIKFQMRNAENYYWFIDDLVLTEAYEMDLALQDQWAELNGGFTETVGHINYLPMSQIGMGSPEEGTIGEYNFHGAIQNVGMADAEDAILNVQVLKNGEEVYNEDSESTLLWALDRDTLNTPDPFLPEDYGDYRINYDAIVAGDERVENNIASYDFTIGDTLYLRSDRSAEASANSGGWGGSNNAGDMVGILYDINAPTEISSLTAYIAGFTAEDLPAFQYVLMKYVIEEEDYVEWLVTEIVEMDSSLMRSWVTLPLDKDGETEFLEPGEYIACVRMWGDNGTEEGSQGMQIGRDLTTKCVNKYTWVYLVSSQSGFSPNKLLMIGMNLNESGGPTEAPVTFNVDINQHILNGEFNPETDILDIPGSFNDWTGSETMTDDDGDGIYSLTIDGFQIAGTIEFKYRINQNWDTSEFPNGGTNRSYQIRYWNDLHHVYNGGETTGIDRIEKRTKTTLFPNPCDGITTLSLSGYNGEDIQLTLTDITGKQIYSKQVVNCVSHMEELDFSSFKGLFFLSVKTDQNTIVRKLIIR